MIKTQAISTHKRTSKGIPKNGSNYARQTVEGVKMFTIVYSKGNGKKVYSETRHMTEMQLNSYKNQLNKAGF
jgi:hypothetical protein